MSVADPSRSVLEVFDSECSKLVIDHKLALKVLKYQTAFVNKNEEHIRFFGGHTIGVQVVRFTDADRDEWFNDILNVDEAPLDERLIALPDINPEFHVSSDTMNLSCVWLAHKFFTAKNIGERERYEAAVAVLLVLQYKYLTSRLYRHFPFPADPQTAEAAYEALNMKFAIRRFGTWSAVLRNRCEDILSKQSIHRQTVDKMDNDKDVVDMLNDTQSRIRDMLKNIYNVFIRIHTEGVRIHSINSSVMHDGESVLRDRTRAVSDRLYYLQSVIADKHSFIKVELVKVINHLMAATMPARLFEETLGWMSDNYNHVGSEMVDEVLNEVLVHAVEVFNQNRGVLANSHDLAGMLSKLRGVYMSSRSTDPSLMALREKTEKMASMATGSKSASTLASVRTGVLLYLVLRAFTMRHYTNAA